MTKEEAIGIFKCLAYHNIRPDEEEIEQAFKVLKPKKGKLIKESVYEFCSVCDRATLMQPLKPKFCPWCGAKIMKESEEE